MDPLFEQLNQYLDPDPARRIVWSTHDQSLVNLASGNIDFIEHTRCALRYKRGSSGFISLSYGAQGHSRTMPLESVLQTSRLPENISFGVAIHEGSSEYSHDGVSAFTAHIKFINEAYVLDCVDVHTLRCEALGFPVLLQVADKYNEGGKKKQFWIPASDLTTTAALLQTNLTQSLDTPQNALLSVYALYHLAK